MRIVFLAILALLYISASIGFTLHTQYCMDMQADRGIGLCKSKVCDKCGSKKINKKDNSCCTNENKFVKNNIDQNIPEQVFHLTHLTRVALPASFVKKSFKRLAAISEIISVDHAPPPDNGVAIYLRDRVFRI